jgi:hypothetical protein
VQDYAAFSLVFKHGGRILTFAVPSDLKFSPVDPKLDLELKRRRDRWLEPLRLVIQNNSPSV